MPDDISYRLHSVSVVVTAEFHNPSILNRDFLVSREIVPEDWDVAEAITTPPVSIVSYANGIQWTVDQSTLRVVENCDSSFRDDYVVYKLVDAYLEKLPHVPYRSLGLNCVISLGQSHPQRWLTERFLKRGPWQEGEPKILHMIPNFTVNARDAVCNLSLSGGQVNNQQNEPMDSVLVNSNVHHAGPLDANELRAAIANWAEKQTIVLLALNKLLER